MNYNEFMDYVCESVKKYLGDDYKISLNKVMKNNGLELTGLVIMKKDCNIAPTVYLDEFYGDYCNGRELTAIMEEIVEIYDQNSNKADFNFDFFLNYETVKDRLLFKIINHEANVKLLDDIPHVRFLDLAVVFYIMLDNDTIGNGSVLIHNNHVAMWNVTTQQIYEDACRNTPRLLPFRFSTMENVVDELYGNDTAKDALIEGDDCSYGMYILTNTNKAYGACCILYKGLLNKISDKIQSNIYIIPSSVHEVIIISKEEFGFTANQIEEMIKSINDNEVDRTEILSYHVYEYDRAKESILMCSGVSA